MKSYDQDFIKIFKKVFAPTSSEPISESALFYPSAGTDFITPIILGLPFCREFYFYEHEPLGQLNRSKQNTDAYEKRINEKLQNITPALSKISGLNLHGRDWIIDKSGALLKFNYDGIERTIYWAHKDNEDFLTKNVNLTFYFHRGDSYGEGGSGQFWDSDLLSELMKKVPNNSRCLFVTDGEPKGLLEPIKENSRVFKIDENIGGNYYFGILPTIDGFNMTKY
jgi:hypothetical protein